MGLSAALPTIAEEHQTGFVWGNIVLLLKQSDSRIQCFLKWLKGYTIPSQMCVLWCIYAKFDHRINRIWPKLCANLTTTCHIFHNGWLRFDFWLPCALVVQKFKMAWKFNITCFFIAIYEFNIYLSIFQRGRRLLEKGAI